MKIKHCLTQSVIQSYDDKKVLKQKINILCYYISWPKLEQRENKLKHEKENIIFLDRNNYYVDSKDFI